MEFVKGEWDDDCGNYEEYTPEEAVDQYYAINDDQFWGIFPRKIENRISIEQESI